MDANIQLPGNNVIPGGNNEPVSNPGYNTGLNASPVSDYHPIAAPASFKYLDDQLNKMDDIVSDEPEEKSANPITRSINTITKATQEVVKQIIMPGVTTVGTASIGYVLLFGRTMYSALAMFLGLGLGSQKLDPATLLEYWERESNRRDDRDKKVEGMFG